MSQPSSYDEAFAANRRRWDECVGIHRRDETDFYRVRDFLAGEDVLGPIERAQIGDVSGERILHLQCHFGVDTLSLARRGALVTGLDFSSRAIEEACALSAKAGVSARFVLANVYDASALGGETFDIVYVTWGAINWLPDLTAWADIVSRYLKPGGHLYLLEGHPFALILEETDDGAYVCRSSYFEGGTAIVTDEPTTYTGSPQILRNKRSYEWLHPVSTIVNVLVRSGLTIEWLNEHDRLPWKLFPRMVPAGDGMVALPPDQPAFPLAFSLKAVKQVRHSPN